jgi:hypothetical protein
VKDRIKGYLSILFFLLALVLPLIGLLAGGLRWDGEQSRLVLVEWDWRVSILAAAIAFAACFGLGILFALRVRRPAWPEILLPFASGIIYSVTNVIPLPFDDILVAAAGAITSYVMALRRYTTAPRWILAPPLAAALYTLVGEFIPGPVDELAVSALAAVVSSVGAGVAARCARSEAPPAAQDAAAQVQEEPGVGQSRPPDA